MVRVLWEGKVFISHKLIEWVIFMYIQFLYNKSCGFAFCYSPAWALVLIPWVKSLITFLDNCFVLFCSYTFQTDRIICWQYYGEDQLMKMCNMQALCVFLCADVWDFLLKKLWTSGRLYVPRIMYRLYYDFSYKVFMVIL